MKARTRCLLLLGAFATIDIVPVPVLALALLYVVLNRPVWFKHLIDRLYAEH